MNSKKILLISLLFGLQGCADLYDSDTPEGSKAALIAVTSCDEGMTSLLAGDEISKTIPDTLLQMNYIEDGSREGCVVSGGAEIERPPS